MGERGYSLLTVLLVMIILALVGSAAVMQSGSDAGTAGARAMHSLALEAASTGMVRYQLAARPSHDAELPAETVLIPTEGIGSTDTDGDGTADRTTRFTVRVLGSGLVMDSVLVESLGEVVEDDRVVARARVTASLGVRRVEDAYIGQVDQRPSGEGRQNEDGFTSSTPLGTYD